MEGRNQFFNGQLRQDRRLRSRPRGEIGTGDGDISKLVGQNLHLTVTHVARQAGQTGESQDSPEQRVGRIGHRDLAFAGFSN